jgi:hypothetical protein
MQKELKLIWLCAEEDFRKKDVLAGALEVDLTYVSMVHGLQAGPIPSTGPDQLPENATLENKTTQSAF